MVPGLPRLTWSQWRPPGGPVTSVSRVPGVPQCHGEAGCKQRIKEEQFYTLEIHDVHNILSNPLPSLNPSLALKE